MRILLTCDPEIPVPPIYYGGVERLVDGLVEEYTHQGHEVYLLANPQSTSIYAKEIFGWPATQSRGFKNVIKNAFFLRKIIHKIKPDVVHSFSRLLYMYPAFFSCKVPFLQTYGRFISTKSTFLASFIGGRKLHFTSAAEHMLNHIKRYRFKFTSVYNFVPTDFFIPSSDEKEYLMFLGRIEPIKGTKEAVEATILAKQKLLIAGNITEGHEDYFKVYVEPYLKNETIHYVGPVNDFEKRGYLQKAKALLFPINLKAEAFGIVMIEAMSCGVPVIAYNIGPVPEVVEEGINGFIVNNVDEMANAIKKIETLNKVEIRDRCVKKFSRPIIAQKYLNILLVLVEKNKKKQR